MSFEVWVSQKPTKTGRKLNEYCVAFSQLYDLLHNLCTEQSLDVDTVSCSGLRHGLLNRFKVGRS